MKKWIIAGLAMYCVSIALAGMRTFTAADGRTLKAELVRYIEMKDIVELNREDGKKLTVSPAAFSEDDQKYIRKWYAGQVFLSESLFKLDVTRNEESKTKKNQEVDFSQTTGPGSGRGTQLVAVDERTKYAINLTLENKSNVQLNNIMLEFRVYYDQQKAVIDEENQREDRPDGEPERHIAVDETKVKEGRTRLKPAEPDSERTVKPTTTVTLLKRSQSGRPYGDMINLKSDLQGAWIRLTMKDVDGKTLTRDVATSDSIMKKFPWETPEELLATDQPEN